MWNLSALAAKAQEAAARIERQLDDSVGMEGSAAASATSPADPNISATHNDLDDDDDFFSDDHGHDALPAQHHDVVREQGKIYANKEAQTPVATKLDVTAHEGDDFFGEDDAIGPVHLQNHQKASQNGDEEIDFGDVDAGGDEWDEAEDTHLDDEEVDSSAGHEQVFVYGKGSINPPELEPISQSGEQLTDGKSSEYLAASPHSSQADVGRNETQNRDITDGQSSIQEENQDASVSKADKLPASPAPGLQSQMAVPPVDEAERQQFLSTIADLEARLVQREEQLASKSDQITSLSLQHESEATALHQAIAETKEEAKKRVVRAKERVEEMQGKLAEAVRRADAAGGSSRENADMIAALRAEGEQLARKQSQMEQAVRNAKGEARELQEKLDVEKEGREKEMGRAETAEKEVKSLKEDLSSARKGESQSKKIEGELVSAREESEKQRASNLILEQQLKELKEENKSLKKEAQAAREGAALELEGESNKLRKERDEMLNDLESKLRTSEREANVREDALRHEVSELRKRWQDAVRRAEDLSMDVQHSTAPLLRQLESTERQNRARAKTWAELETKLRSDLESHVIQSERLTKERNNLIVSDKRLRRLLKEKDDEIASSQGNIDQLSTTIENLETKVDELEEGRKKIKQELLVANRKASEGASKVRTEMMQAVVDSEERYQTQIDALEKEVEEARQMRSNLEKQIDELAESMVAVEFAQGELSSPVKEKRLRSADNQASILHNTLMGIDSDVDGDESDEDGLGDARCQGSFAAMEQLSLGLKGATLELEALRKQLATSEETRESLVEELGEARQAVEKLPLFEQKVNDLAMEVKLKDMEIQGLQDDISDVRFLYRTQLDALLEEKASLHIEENKEDGSKQYEN